jgi:hypothetical protein
VKLESGIKNQESGVRKIYVAPRLFKYGSVRDLTKSGTTSGAEPITGNHCKQSSPYKSCSERRVKEKIVRIGTHPLGFGLYLFDYRPEYRDQWGYGRQFGVMIDEVEDIVPEAVFIQPNGYKLVDYGRLGVSRRTNLVRQ